MTEQLTPVRSPCTGVCALDEQDLCIACRRSGMEIAEWGVMSDEQKLEVYSLIRQRELADKQKRSG